jgi:small subunit ribosomal protein S21
VIEIKLKRNENIDRALKRLKRIMDKDGILRELKERNYYEKPSVKKKKKKDRAKARRKKEARDARNEKKRSNREDYGCFEEQR